VVHDCIRFLLLSVSEVHLEILIGVYGGKLCLLVCPGEYITSAFGMLTGALSERKSVFEANEPKLLIGDDEEGEGDGEKFGEG